MPLPGQRVEGAVVPCSAAPLALVDAVRARIAPLFPDWEHGRIEILVQQMASVEWRYLVSNEIADGLARTRPCNDGEVST